MKRRFIKLDKNNAKKLNVLLETLTYKHKRLMFKIEDKPKKKRVKRELRKLDNEHPLKDNNLKAELSNLKSREVKFKPSYLKRDYQKEKLKEYLKEYDKLEWLKELIQKEKVIILNKEDFNKLFKISIIKRDPDIIFKVKYKDYVYITTRQIVENYKK